MRRTLKGIVLAAVTVAATAIAAPAQAYPHISCGGTKAMDTALATSLRPKLNGKMAGILSGYHMSCARRIVEIVRNRGLAKRAAAIAVTTAIQESLLENINVELDHDSLGLFQQRASWGTAAQRLDPAWATNAFLNRMISLYPNNAWNNTANTIGTICQAVQVSAFPDAYQLQASDGSTIAYNILDALNGSAPTKPVDTIGAWYPASFSFHLLGANAAGNSKWAFVYGRAGDRPLTGDWDGNGKDSVGIFRPGDGSRDGEFHLTNSLSSGVATYMFTGGLSTDIPLAGDWDGDGKDSTGFYRPSTGNFHLKNGLVTGASDYAFSYGPDNAGVIPLAGDWNGDGRDSIGYYDPADMSFHLSNDLASGSSDYAYVYGRAGDKPVMGDWDGNGTDTPGVFRPSSTQFFLRNSHSNGNANITFTGFLATSVPLSGDWDDV